MFKIVIPEKAKQIINQLEQAGYEAYVVGGPVRDCILGKCPTDWDITTSASPYQVKEIFSYTIDTGIAHGTVTVMMGKEPFEVTTYRVDGEYKDHRRPEEVCFTKSLKEDLLRRDFTINAMAYNDRDGLIDYYGGAEDLKKKTIRCVGDARRRFDEDALRILRALRFQAQLGFVIEEEQILFTRVCNDHNVPVQMYHWSEPENESGYEKHSTYGNLVSINKECLLEKLKEKKQAIVFEVLISFEDDSYRFYGISSKGIKKKYFYVIDPDGDGNLTFLLEQEIANE